MCPFSSTCTFANGELGFQVILSLLPALQPFTIHRHISVTLATIFLLCLRPNPPFSPPFHLLVLRMNELSSGCPFPVLRLLLKSWYKLPPCSCTSIGSYDTSFEQLTVCWSPWITGVFQWWPFAPYEYDLQSHQEHPAGPRVDILHGTSITKCLLTMACFSQMPLGMPSQDAVHTHVTLTKPTIPNHLTPVHHHILPFGRSWVLGILYTLLPANISSKLQTKTLISTIDLSLLWGEIHITLISCGPLAP